ncbi:hypothetical protein Tco_0011289 [Tanacetum coccineum]
MSEAEPIPPTSSVTALRIPMIKKGEYDLCSMKMRQYIAITDHILWDIITNETNNNRPASLADLKQVTFAMMALTELEEDDWSMEIDAEPMHFGQDGLGDFDWSNTADDTPVSLALMATIKGVWMHPRFVLYSMDYDIMIFGYLVTDDWVQSTSFTTDFGAHDSMMVTTMRNSDDEFQLRGKAMIDAAVANALPNLTAALRTQITNDIRNGAESSGGSGGGGDAVPQGIHVWIKRLRCCPNIKLLHESGNLNKRDKNGNLIQNRGQGAPGEQGSSGTRTEEVICEVFKVRILVQQVAFLGHIVSADGIIMDPSKVEAITKWPRPTTVTGGENILGLAVYLPTFCLRVPGGLCQIYSDSSKPANWLGTSERLSNTNIQYHPARLMWFADALVENLGMIVVIDSRNPSWIIERIGIMFEEDGKHTEIRVDDGGVVWFEDRLCVPNDQALREKVMMEAPKFSHLLFNQKRHEQIGWMFDRLTKSLNSKPIRKNYDPKLRLLFGKDTESLGNSSKSYSISSSNRWSNTDRTISDLGRNVERLVLLEWT